MTRQEPPPAATLTRAQHAGWACCFCGASLRETGGVPAGRAKGWSGAHDLSVDVYACPPLRGCRPLQHTQTPAHSQLHEPGASGPSRLHPEAHVHNRRKT